MTFAKTKDFSRRGKNFLGKMERIEYTEQKGVKAVILPEHVKQVMEQLRAGGYEARAVGGCVRDGLMGLVPHDWDICTDASPEEMKECFRDFRILETGLRHGTVTVLSQGEAIEVTAYRAESAYSDHRHPDAVRFVRCIEEDLSRRDFTVNAMAWDPQEGLIDRFDGQGDLQRKLIRCVGEPRERFREDPLRILRALRFAARFCFSLEEKTAAAMREEKELLRHISAERILAELKGIVMGRDGAKLLGQYREILQVVLPEAQPFGAEAPEDLEIRLALLVKDTGAQALKELRCDNALLRAVTELLEAPKAENPLQLRKLAVRYGKERCRQIVLMQGGDMERLEQVLENSPCLSLKELAVSGEDLLALGLPKGPVLGQKLQELLELVLEEKLPNEKEALLAYAKSGKLPKEEESSSAMALGMCLGIGVGVALGAALDNLSLWMCIGLSVGMCLGLAADREKKK